MSKACARQSFGVVGAPPAFHIQANGPAAHAAAGGCNAALLVNDSGGSITLTGGASGASLLIGSSSGVDVSGALNFTGALLQNGAPFAGSQWTTLAADAGLSYEMDVTVKGTLYASNLAILGSVESINAYTTMTSNLVITNRGTGPALVVAQSETGQPVATFSAGSNLGLIVSGEKGSLGVGGITAPTRSLDVSGDARVSGTLTSSNISFTGALIQNGAPYIGSQWTSLNGGVTFASNVAVGKSSFLGGSALDVSGSVAVSGAARAGALGIGKDASGHALDVSGNALISGALNVTGDITAYYSDDRLKTRISDLSGALNIVDRLSAFRYSPNDVAINAGFPNKIGLGLSAQEVGNVFPEIVTRAPFDVGGSGSKSGENYLTIQYERITPVLVQAIQELRQEVRELRQELHIFQKKTLRSILYCARTALLSTAGALKGQRVEAGSLSRWCDVVFSPTTSVLAAVHPSELTLVDIRLAVVARMPAASGAAFSGDGARHYAHSASSVCEWDARRGILVRALTPNWGGAPRRSWKPWPWAAKSWPSADAADATFIQFRFRVRLLDEVHDDSFFSFWVEILWTRRRWL